MYWVIVSNTHVNADAITCIRWKEGTLWVWFLGEEKPAKWTDPDRAQYRKLCQDIGLNAIEEAEP